MCYGIGPCAVDKLVLIQDFKLPKTLCEWGTGFLSGLSSVHFTIGWVGVKEDISHYRNLSGEVYVWKFTCFFLMIDFSLHSWLLDRGLNISSALSSVDATSLLSSLGVSEFLKDPQCSRRSAIYQTSINGWKNGMSLMKSG